MDMDKDTLRGWRKQQGLTRRELGGMLGVTPMALAYWEWGNRQIPALLPLALEALEYQQKGGGASMLALTLREGETLLIGEAKVKVTKIQGKQVRVGVEAPPEVRVARQERPVSSTKRS